MKKESLDRGWKFRLEGDVGSALKSHVATVDLPHSWGEKDGFGAAYRRGAGVYTRTFTLYKCIGAAYYLEFGAAFSAAEVYVNKAFAGRHEGGFSLFRFDVTKLLKTGQNELEVRVDGADKEGSRGADFASFGGLYRGASLITASQTRFDLDYFGSEGVRILSAPDEKGGAQVDMTAYVTNPRADLKVGAEIYFLGERVAEQSVPCTARAHMVFELCEAHLWQGKRSPLMYEARLCITDGIRKWDERTIKFGIRGVRADKEGFWLNGERLPLRGVAVRQDRCGKGWAVTDAEEREDFELIKELGANTLRLAYHQHAPLICELADREGLCVWADMPGSGGGEENATRQLRELIVQNFHHPSIVCWGIGGSGDFSPHLMQKLNALAHELDPARFTVAARSAAQDAARADAPAYDLCGDKNDARAENVAARLNALGGQRALALSEYGCEGVAGRHALFPEFGDRSLESQAEYHEEMIKLINAHPELWATHVRSMFDFASAPPAGAKSVNGSGLASYDRKVKKDAFYLYKAYWSEEPFVHVAGGETQVRAGETAVVKVYSNLPEVTLYAGKKAVGTLKADKVFRFEVPLKRRLKVEAHAGAHVAKAKITRVKVKEKKQKGRKDVGV